ncbi:MAG: MBL fold metallo-hydrolase [Symbiobacterium sp.]|uniref:MBL fold metallo-hydrolase n=1 Tax=Symbiobacterium sp. TaxID=1971213 RepID=UPI00346436CB
MLPIHQIPLPTPFPGLGPVHVYLVRQDPVTLIDAGLRTQECREALTAGLAALGLAVSDVRRVLLTHAHVDHFGLAGWIQEQSGAEVYLHPEEQAKAEASPWWEEQLVRAMEEAGVGPDQIGMAREFWRLERKLTAPLAGWRPLADGQIFPFEGGQLEAVHLPGHALGHTGFLDRAGRTLLGGDHLLEGVTPNPIMEPVLPGHRDAVPHDPSRAMTLAQFLRSLDRVEAMDLDRVLPGHGPVITDHRAVVARYRTQHARRLDAVLGLLGPGRRPWELTGELFPRVQGFHQFLALSEVVAHLDLLVVQGRARFDRHSGFVSYRAAV